ncbi:MAG: TauD/TfdA family dioxygenase [Gammaproteobacteria bacterium]|nr:TauD/TfdA family dioxygenase [Gammaproteobacteria bacterium]
MKVEVLTPTIGAEVSGIDLRSASDADFAQVLDAFHTHQVVFFRDQPALTPHEHNELAKRFGEPHVHPAAPKDREFPQLLVIKADANTKVAAGDRWHSDVSCDAAPPLASILQLHTLPPHGGDTLFVSMYAAYEALSDPMKAYLEGLTARHSGEYSYKKLFKFKKGGLDGGFPTADHPVIRRHPATGKPALYVNPEFTESLNGIPPEESEAILNFLYRHAEKVSFQVRFRWTPNAIAIWDNRCTMHHAIWDYWPAERRGHRISVTGEVPELYRA